MIEYRQWLTTTMAPVWKVFQPPCPTTSFHPVGIFSSLSQVDLWQMWACFTSKYRKKTCWDAILTPHRSDCGRWGLKEKINPGGDWNPGREGTFSIDCMYLQRICGRHWKVKTSQNTLFCVYKYLLFDCQWHWHTPNSFSQILTTKVCFILSAAQVL